MRIIIANKFHYPRGGDCVYSLDLERLLKAKGHDVAFFAMDYPHNEPSEWHRYFPAEVSFSFRPALKTLRGILRPLYSPEVRRKFSRLLEDFKPDVVHLNNIHTQLSPVIAQIAKQHGIRVVWTLHDYKLLCPCYDCLRNGKPCELCHGGSKAAVLKYSCLKGSRLASAIAYLEARKWNREELEQWTDAFICPSHFMQQKMVAGRFNAAKLHVIHNFIAGEKRVGARVPAENHYCYVGRLSEAKGIRTLLRAASQLTFPLKVIGTGGLEAELKQRFAAFPQIEFLGHRNWETLRPILESARFLVLPSEWYENNPLSIIEALALGVPVLGSDIGGIPELIRDEPNCRLFEAGNAHDLAEKLAAMWSQDAARPPPDKRADEYSADRHLEQLLPLYEGRP